MSDAGKAVFLSYASQDAEAARRICEALRTAGVEVWFDQSELVGGDAWDQKIRKQIRECALFVPILSQTTQGRREAYFRLEWKLADERTHLMAKGTPFLLPVTIDGTNDRDALVPDSFCAVQWTKLPGGETSPAFCERVKKLLGGSELEPGRPGPGNDTRGGVAAPPAKASPRWLRPVLASAALVIVVLAVTLRKSSDQPAPPALSPGPAATAPRSEARQLVERAWLLSEENKNNPDGLRAVADLAEKATQLDPTDGEVWATAGMVDIRCWVHAADRTEKREEMARTKILRAKGLAPRAVRTRMAEARMLTELDLYPDGGPQAEAILRELKGEKLQAWEATEVLGVLGLALCKQGRGPEGAPFLEQAGREDAGWMSAASWTYLSVKMFPEALAAARRQTELDRTSGLQQQAWIQFARGDLDAVQAALEQLPAAARTEELPAAALALLAYYQRDAGRMQAAWRLVPGDFVQNGVLSGPKGLVSGYAHLLAGRPEAAKVEWEAALAVVDQHLAGAGTDADLLQMRLRLLALLGRHDEAERVYQILQQLHGGLGYGSESQDLVMLGRKEEALARLQVELRQRLNTFGHTFARFDPAYDPLRGDPRFEKLLHDTLAPGAKPFDDPKP
jgi:tetratricopeptide (TPR) repeat protein